VTYPLDTNTCIVFLRQRNTALIEKFQEHQNDLAVCAVVKAGLLHGVHRSAQRERNLTVLREFLAPFPSLPFDDVGAECYGRIRADLANLGQPIGPNDLLIAATAIANQCTLVTHNTREFNRVPNLKIEDWES
jgi:tRNA(fMet)-specific endonuclease VapC